MSTRPSPHNDSAASKPRTGGVLLAVGALILLSCGPEVDSVDSVDSLRLLERWVATEPTVDSDSLILFRETEVFRWSFRTADDIAPWTPYNADLAYELTGDGLYIRSSTHDPYIVRATDFQAEDVTRLRVRHSGLNSASMQFFWADENEAFSEDRSITVSTESPGGTMIPYYSFDVGHHPEWKGRIRRFRIDPTSHAKRRVELFSMTAYRRQLDPDLFTTAVAAPVRAEMGSAARSALLAPPGIPIERRLELPDGAVLRFAYGLQTLEGPPVTFRVTLARDGERTELFCRILVPESDGDTWRTAEVDLSPFSGDEVNLSLETESTERIDLLDGFPLWGHPEVLASKKDERPPNVVLVVVDTLRADHMSLYGYARPTTPRLAEWAARRGVVFEQTVAPAPWTLPSHVSLFSGRDALHHSVNHAFPAPYELTFLAERLREEGYATAAFTGGAFVLPAYGLAQGFDVFQWSQDHEKMTYKDLEEGLRRALAWIEAAPEPFFLFLHTYEIHAPYQAKEPWYTQFGGEPATSERGLPDVLTRPAAPVSETGWRYTARFMTQHIGSGIASEPLPEERLGYARLLYDTGIAHTDEQLDRLWNKLEASGLADRTVTVFTSDHGEGLGEHGSAGHANLHEFNLMVPLVMALPDGHGAGRRIPTQVRLIDVAPTVLDALGLEGLPEADGRSLLPLVDDPAAPFPREAESYAGSSNFGLSLRVGGRWKYIYQNTAWEPLWNQQELFDLRDDPEELANLAGSSPMSERFFDELRRRYRETARHLRVLVRNREDRPLQVVLRGKLAHAFTVKTFERPACEGCVRWEKGETRVDLPPGDEVRLFLEGSPQGDLKVVLARPRRGSEERPIRFLRMVRLEDFVEPWRLRLGDDSWVTASQPLADDETGIEIVWHGDMASRAESSALSDEDLREQLESLGYLN